MQCTIEPSTDGKYIVQTVSGEITRELAMEYNRDAHALGRAMRLNKYLVDMRRARNVDTIFNNYNFAYKDMKNDPAIDIAACIAVVVSPGDHSHDFIETVAQNSGLNVTLFTDWEKAVKHLLE